MSDPGTKSSPVHKLADNLQTIKADFAHRTPEEQQWQLAQEVHLATEQLSAKQRAAFLDQLLQQFPGWSDAVNQPSPSAPSEQQWNDPAALIAQLAAVIAREPARRREVLTKLQASGLIAAHVPEPWLVDLQRQLKISEKIVIDPRRMVDLLMSMLDFVKNLESYVNGAWNSVARGVGGPMPKPLGDAVARYVTLSAAGPRPAGLQDDVENGILLLDRKVRVLIAALRAVSQQHAAKFAPAEIESMIEVGFLANKTKAAWEKYVQLCGGLERENLDAEIRMMQSAIIERIWSSAGE